MGIGMMCLLAAAPPATTARTGAGQPPPHQPGRVIVRFKPGVSTQARDRVDAEQGSHLVRRLLLTRTNLVRVRPGRTVEAAVTAYERDPNVLYAEPDYPEQPAVSYPGDPAFDQSWGLDNTGQAIDPDDDGPRPPVTGTPDADIDAPEAWDLSTGSQTTVVAVLDSGVDYDHPDLAANIWSNPGETGGGKESNGVDDDGNGFVDDFRGWDFSDGDNDPQDASPANGGHGTHVAGVLGSVGGNDAGSAGLNWQVRILPLKRCRTADGLCSISAGTDAIAYAAQMGVKVLNYSMASDTYSQTQRDAIAAASDTLVVAPAGNGGADRIGDDDDAAPTYPCSYDPSNVICVAASDQTDGLASFSNYGATSVDLAAPGANIRSTNPYGPLNGYGTGSGTSFAAPAVAGTAAMLLGLDPSLSVSDLRTRIEGSVDPLPAFAGTTVTGGRLNLFKAVSGLLGGTGYPRPKGATPVRISLVPAYTRCTAPNLYHGPPDLPGGADPDRSCGPAGTSSLASPNLTVGTADANGLASNFTGSVRWDVVAGNPATPENEADAGIVVALNDVRCQGSGGGCAGGPLSDYAGEVSMQVNLRVTDRPPLQTTADFAFVVPITCTPTAGPKVGSNCATITTANAVLPGAVVERHRTILRFSKIWVIDGGADGVAATQSDNAIFATQGVFVP